MRGRRIITIPRAGDCFILLPRIFIFAHMCWPGERDECVSLQRSFAISEPNKNVSRTWKERYFEKLHIRHGWFFRRRSEVTRFFVRSELMASQYFFLSLLTVRVLGRKCQGKCHIFPQLKPQRAILDSCGCSSLFIGRHKSSPWFYTEISFSVTLREDKDATPSSKREKSLGCILDRGRGSFSLGKKGCWWKCFR